MAKGTRKKTKWVSLSLASTSTTDTDTVAQNLGDKSSVSTRGTKTYKTVVTESNGEPISSSAAQYNASKAYDYTVSDRKSSSFVYGRFRKPLADGSAASYSSGEHTHSHPHKPYASYSKDHYNNYNYQNASSGRTYHSSYNESSSFSSKGNKLTSNCRNEPNDGTTINEDEYTKITTPRQDVLFKKGYLSRPKKYGSATATTSEDEPATASSSVNGGTVDGSDVMTASGSASAAESVMSDATYLTEGHFVDYAAPYPYFGYIDQSGVLVMNGFAVDNSGFSYMNGGQTYIYPPNYHCQPAFEGDNQVAGGFVNSSAGPPVEPIETAVCEISHTMDATGIGDSGCCDGDLPEKVNNAESEGASCFQQTQYISNNDETLAEGTVVEQGIREVGNTDNSDQQVPQEQIDMNVYVNGYDYSQLYNTFYYPGCVMTPLTVFENVPFYDQCGVFNEDYNSRSHSFKKRKKRYRHWEEQTNVIHSYGTTEPNTTPSEMVESDGCTSAKVSTTDASAECMAETRRSSENPPTERAIEAPSDQPSTIPPEIPPKAPKAETRSQLNQTSQIQTNKFKAQLPKSRKKDLIESTLAFAMQNIDLTKEAACRQSANEMRKSEESAWKTVRNGKEIVTEEDQELRCIDTTAVTKMASIKEIPETLSNEQLSCETGKQENALVIHLQHEAKPDHKDVAGCKKGKKTAKGKGKKQKKSILSQQHKGFELIEPEFMVSMTVDGNDEDEERMSYIAAEELDMHQKETSEIVQEEVETGCDALELSQPNNCFQEVKNVDIKEDFTTEIQSVQLCSTLTNDVYLSLAESIIESKIGESNFTQEKENILENQKECRENEEVPLELAEIAHSEGLSIIDISPAVNDEDKTETTYPSPGLASSCDEAPGEEENDSKCGHFSGEEGSEKFDSGLQSPAAFIASTSEGGKERKLSFSSYKINGMHMTDAVTKWLSETLSNKRLEEMFIIPEDPTLLHRIHQFNLMNLDESFLLSSDSYSSSSGDEAEDIDSDYMSDVQRKKHPSSLNDCNSKSESQKDVLAKPTANGHYQMNVDHSNHKQKRCIIM